MTINYEAIKINETPGSITIEKEDKISEYIYWCPNCTELFYAKYNGKLFMCECWECWIDWWDIITRIIWNPVKMPRKFKDVQCDIKELEPITRYWWSWWGWDELIKMIVDVITTEPNANNIHIKEKFWHLDIYHQWVSEEWEDLLLGIEWLSAHVCEECHSLWTGRRCWGRLRTLCFKHYAINRLNYYFCTLPQYYFSALLNFLKIK